MEALASLYIPMDRRFALAQGEYLPYHNQGSVLFADISGFTPLTAALLKELGLKRGPEELTRQLNLVYDALISEVYRFGGSVIGFAGDAITCWFENDDGLRATACGLGMQQAMAQFRAIVTPAGTEVSLGMKAAVAVGPVRRFIVGDPQTQLIDLLAGATLARMAEAEHQAERGEVIVAPEVLAGLGDQLKISEVRVDPDSGQQFGVVASLTQSIAACPWPTQIPLTEAQVQPWLLRPIYDQLKSGQGEFLAEIRPAVALFMRFGGLDFDADDQAGQKLDAYIRWVQSVLDRYGGFLLSIIIGDKGSYLYATFGALISHENDPARAVASALELHNPPEDLAFVGPVQIGITQGRVRAGTYGGTTRHTYGAIGDEINMAARLMQNAEPGQTMVSQRIAQAVAQEYQMTYLGPIIVKGKDEPIPVSLVVGRHRQTARKPVDQFATPLVGREAELNQIAPLLAGAASGAGQVLRIEGPPGIGKSHLVAVFAEEALLRFWRVVTGTCHSTSQDIPYHPWRQIFRSLFVLIGEPDETEAGQYIAQVEAIIEQINPAWLVRLPLLGDLLGLPIPDNSTTAAFEPRLRQEALFTFVIDLLRSWTKTQSILLLIEDTQWQDEASRELTVAVARVATLTRIPLLLVLTHRPPLDPSRIIFSDLESLPHYHVLELDELAPAGVAALVANRLPGQPAPLLLNLIQTQAKGNPFFVEAFLEALREADHLTPRDDGSWALAEPIVQALRQANCLLTDERGELILNPEVPVANANLDLPDSIYGLILARIDRLLEAHKLTLKVASVIGRMFQFQLLARSHPVETDPDSLLEQIEIIEEREFTRLETPLPDLVHIFRQNATRDVAYDTLLEAQQRQLHLAVAEAIELLLPDSVELLAYHYSRAKVRDKTLLYLERAARKAQHDYANETALNYYSQALALDERWPWYKGQIETLHILGRRDEEQTALERMAALVKRGTAEIDDPSPDTSPAFEVAYLWGQYYEAIADYPQAQTAIERALNLSRAANQRLNETICLARFGAIAYKQGRYEEAATWYEQALGNYPGADHFSEAEVRVVIEALNGLGTAYRQQGVFEQTQRCHERALQLSREQDNRPGEARAFNDLGVMAFYRRHFSESLSYHRQALEIRRAMGDRAGEGTSLYNMAMATRDANDYGQAQLYLSEALNILQVTGNRWDEANVWNELGILYQEVGDLAQAQSCLERALQLNQDIGDEGGKIYILGNLGLVTRDLGDLEAAEAYLSEGLTLAQRQQDNYVVALFLSHLAVVSLGRNDLALAVERAEQALTLRRELQLLLWTTADLATLAAATQANGHPVDALDYAGQALAILDGCNGQGPELPQRDYFICYQVFAAHGRADQAWNALQAAHRLVMARADKITDPALRQSFLEQVTLSREIVAAYQQSAGQG